MTPLHVALTASFVALVALVYLTLSAPSAVHVWLTPDQLGRLAYERREFRSAAERFEDPAWRGAARYASGQYVEAAADFARSRDPAALFNRGVALLKGREYARAVAAFELAAAEAPDWAQAQENLRLARYVLTYLEEARDESGTGGKLEADGYRFDVVDDGGERVVIRDDSAVMAQSTEKWMRSVDTRTSEFLELRFSLESARRNAP